ncbi:MAG: hypothetical protein ACR2M9_03515 [Cyanophyceae cyanobacterium]
MAKKVQAEETVEVAPQPTVAKKAPVKKEPTKPKWEIKDRTYILKGSFTPLTYTLPSRHSVKYPLLWFDNENGVQKELRYATNQNSPLVEEQNGQSTLGHIVFNNGTLFVPKEKQNLQKLLSLYHPALNNRYFEFNKVAVANNDLVDLELEIEALNAAKSMEIDQAEAILRVEIGSEVSKMTSREIKRDLLMFAKKNASLFIELANDENVQLRNFAVKATEAGIINLSPDKRTFTWATNGRKLMTVPFDEHPYSAMAAFFKTDEGIEVFKSVEKKLS